jgi:hypothetical protein
MVIHVVADLLLNSPKNEAFISDSETFKFLSQTQFIVEIDFSQIECPFACQVCEMTCLTWESCHLGTPKQKHSLNK